MFAVGEFQLHRDGQPVLCGDFVRGDGSRADFVACDIGLDLKVSVHFHFLQLGHLLEFVLHRLGQLVGEGRIDLEGLVAEIVDGDSVDVRVDGGAGKRIFDEAAAVHQNCAAQKEDDFCQEMLLHIHWSRLSVAVSILYFSSQR